MGGNPQSMEENAFLWQAEVQSQGASTDMSYLAPFFLEAMFSHFTETVTNEEFKIRVKKKR